jgi:threonine/homoserine/homoserine lactone efflux protein
VTIHFLINTLNPSVIGLWLAASTRSIGQRIDEKIAIFSVCLTINILADIAKINLAGKLKKSLTERNMHYINIISGLLFVAFGIVLMISVLYNPSK